MNNQLMQMPVNDMMTMAKTFAESGMFQDTRQMAQAFVKIQAGAEIGIGAFQAMSGLHVIAGKPVIGAGIMAAKVKGSGKYDYKVVKHDDKICSIDFYQGKEMIGNSTFTIEDAKKAGTKNLDKFPKNMLFARALSNGVKWFTPDVFTGTVYVEGEIPSDNTTEDVTATVVSSALPNLNPGTKKYELVVEKLRSRTSTVAQVKEYFTLSLETEWALAAIEKAAQTTTVNEPATAE